MKTSLQIGVAIGLGLFALSGRGAEVVKSEVNEDGLVADFFCQPDATNQLGILVFGGSEGGKPKGGLARSLAEHGYPTLAVAYFKEKGLPESLQSIPLEYFDKPIAWLMHHKSLSAGGIVVIGNSRGGELALLLASVRPEIKGVIAISPSSVVWNGMSKEPPIIPCSSWTLAGKPVPFMPYNPPADLVPGDWHAIFSNFERALAQKEAVERAAIKVEQIRGPILVASGHDDIVWPAEAMGDAIDARLQKNRFPYLFEHLKFENAGHTLDERWMLGGTFQGNQEARSNLFQRILVFIKTLGENSAPRS